MAFCCKPRWTTDTLSELYLEHLEASSNLTHIYVESLDGIQDPRYIADLLLRWGVTLEQPALPIVNEPQQLLRLIEDDRYFPGYDTVWFINPTAKSFSPPTFITWYATEQENALVLDRSTSQPVPWHVVSDWMFNVGAWVGLSQGVNRLEVSLVSES